MLAILMVLAAAGQQPRDVTLIVNTERLGRTKKYAQTRPALPPPAPGSLAKLSDVPNVAVTYYDVPGRDLDKIHAALAKRAPRDPETRRILPATSAWTVAVKVRSLTTGRTCSVTGASLGFRGSAVLPRLVPDPERPAPVAAAWSAWLTRLEARQAEQLRFAYGQLGEVERAVLASRCGKAEAAADAALARLQQRQRLAFPPGETDLPRLDPAEE